MGSSDQHSRPRSCIINVIAIVPVKTGSPWDGAVLYCDVGDGEDDMMRRGVLSREVVWLCGQL